mmetsp:Transcript_29603/g.45159  ORF Transcript_29603/g.45159 Transcript_29603/m.45159 type:complete len:644 (+) Transcript_29603:39-1970(+)
MAVKTSIGYTILVLLQLYSAIGQIIPIPLLLASTLPDRDSSDEYSNAKQLRIKLGHSAASTAYRKLLVNNQDVTAATRIAAAVSSPYRHDKSCPLPARENQDDEVMIAISQLRSILDQSGYNNRGIQQIFGIKSLDLKAGAFFTKTQSLAFAKGPIYAKPVSAHASCQLPFFFQDLDKENKPDSSLKCLVALFLLGYSVPMKILSRHLKGEYETIGLLEKLGLAFPCETDPSIIVPYVHIFPLQIGILDGGDSETTKPLLLVTDLHPAILSRTTLGTKEEGAVMYIGPDSLALTQHSPVRFHLSQLLEKERLSPSRQETKDPFQILDFCTGSGVQALATLALLERVNPEAIAVCIDINERALRFAKFNGFLNGFDGSRVNVIKADLISGKILDPISDIGSAVSGSKKEKVRNISSILDFLIKTRKEFDIILGNPPFIPLPKVQEDDISKMISKRYGLFSSGGSSGEEVLKSIITMSSRLLRKDGGLLAIVSEFMNPPTTSNPSEKEKDKEFELVNKICNWWDCKILGCNEQSPLSRGKGLLFTNQLPLSASKYATRRADDEQEYSNWIRNLESHNIRHVSPGLLYIKAENSTNAAVRDNDENRILDLGFKVVPKDDELGSMWTPYNYKAVHYIAREWERKAKS